MTFSLSVMYLKGSISGRIIYLPSLKFLYLRGYGGRNSSIRSPKKKPDLVRVNTYLNAWTDISRSPKTRDSFFVPISTLLFNGDFLDPPYRLFLAPFVLNRVIRLNIMIILVIYTFISQHTLSRVTNYKTFKK